MKLSLALGIVSAMAQVGLAGKCLNSVPVSSAEDASVPGPYSTVPMPPQYIEPSTTAGPYSTVPMPSDFSPDYGVYSTAPMPSDFVYTNAPATEEEQLSTASSPEPDYSAAPTATTTTPPSGAAGAYQITLEQLNKAVPDRAADSSCGSAPYPDECVTNSRAVSAINNALTKYGISRRSEAVAVISLMAFESESWLYNKNHYPGNPGQGARNMQMYDYNSEYAKLLYPDKVAQVLASDLSNSTQQMNDVRDLVLGDNDSFGAGFWYLTVHASKYHNNANALRDGNSADFQDYVVTGVDAGWSDGRMTIWNSVNSALSA
ncbi:hypothetical protein H4S06_002619 [Coemansia sp. BCRC 34490]|nr:hypothetical protein H4S06_002619 [Coemansia sp. BCRC 34490]